MFPLFVERASSLDYLLSDEAMAAGTLAVSEVSETGEVPFLLVDNGGDQPALFVEGEEVRGGKQNRILASSVLVAGRVKLAALFAASRIVPPLRVSAEVNE